MVSQPVVAKSISHTQEGTFESLSYLRRIGLISVQIQILPSDSAATVTGF